MIAPYYETECGKLYHGHVLDVLRELPDKSVNCCVTSPPYWGLRDYDVSAQIWGGDSECKHVFNTEKICTEIGKGNWSQAVNGRGEIQGDASDFRKPIRSTSERGFCRKCGAWIGSHGLEPSPDLFVEHEVLIFNEVFRVLADDGSCWINFGDTYAMDDKWGGSSGWRHAAEKNNASAFRRQRSSGLKSKDLIGIPWRVAFALQSEGWYLRQDIIWHKPNTMPESVKDRCTKAHEYIFLLSKSARYYFNQDAIKEPVTGNAHPRGNGVNPKAALRGDHPRNVDSRYKAPGQPEHTGLRKAGLSAKRKVPNGWDTSKGNGGHGKIHKDGRQSGTKWNVKQNESFSSSVNGLVGKRNKRSVWNIPTHPFPQAHFATFPPALIEPCIMAGCPPEGIVLDPFIGSGTTAIVAHKHDRKFLGIELNKKYLDEIAIPRIEAKTAQLKLFA